MPKYRVNIHRYPIAIDVFAGSEEEAKELASRRFSEEHGSVYSVEPPELLVPGEDY